MDSFARLIELNNWGLRLPIVQGQEVSMQTIAATPPDAFEGQQLGTRPLRLQSPMLRGLVARLSQLGLSELGLDVRADAICGGGSRDAVVAFQQRSGMPVTGMLEVATVVHWRRAEKAQKRMRVRPSATRRRSQDRGCLFRVESAGSPPA